jgi:hypothetical protein
MRRLPQQISLFAFSVLTVGVLGVAPVYARQGSDDSGSGGTTTTTTTTTEVHSTGSGSSGSGRSGGTDDSVVRSTSTSSSSSSSDDDDGTDDRGSGDIPVTTKETELRDRARKLVAEKRDDKASTKKLEVRQKSCEARKANIIKRSDNYSASGKKHLDVFNSIYDKVLKFQADKQLSAANFGALKATADAKKAAATEAVNAIASVTTDVDCTSTDPAASVASVKESVKNARTALHEYRLAIKDVVVALQKSVDDNGTNDANDDNSATNTTTTTNTTEAQ